MKMYGVLLTVVCMVFNACEEKRGLIVGKVQKAAKLSTTEFTVDKLVWGVKDKRILWVIKLNQAQFLAQSQAIIKAGVNLENIEEGDIIIEGDKINVTLPHVEVLNFSYPVENFKEVDILTKNTFSTKINLDDQEKFFQDAEIDIRNSLEHMGIVETTRDKTRIMIEAMLRNLGYKEIYIQFKDGPLITKITPDS